MIYLPVLFILLMPVSANAEMLNVEPIGHFLISASATYTLTSLCELHLTRIAEHCQWIVPALVISYAVWERNYLPGFEDRSLIADIGGAGFGIIVFRW